MINERNATSTSRSIGVPRISLGTLLQFSLIALAIKTVFLVEDPNPQFFLGDSGSYLWTALTGWIPPDRSYLYGFLIQSITIKSGSLFSLVLVQTLASAFSAGVLGWILLRFFDIRNEIATVAVVLYSLEPLQLLYERFVMAETFSLMAAMLFIVFLFVYLENGRKRFLVLASFLGVVSVALRMSFLPPVIVLSFAAPLIRFFFAPPEGGAGVHARLRALLLALAVVTISHLFFHDGYKLLTGRLAGEPPAYQYADGLFLLSAWSPVMTPNDLLAAGLSEQVIAGSAKATLEARRTQRWQENGLVAALNRHYGDSMKANAAAKKISLHILKRDPIGVFRLAVRTYFRGWRREVIKGCIQEDSGNRAIPADMVQSAARHFHVVASDMPTRRYADESLFSFLPAMVSRITPHPAAPLSDHFLFRPALPPLSCLRGPLRLRGLGDIHGARGRQLRSLFAPPCLELCPFRGILDKSPRLALRLSRKAAAADACASFIVMIS